MSKYRILAIISFFLLCMPMMAQKPQTILLYNNGKAPHSNGNKKDTALVQVFLPTAKKATGRAVLICPGGGYSHLAFAKEGTDWAPFFNRLGIAAIVLKYRMPHGVTEVPIEDAENAMRLIRRNATAWHINPKDVGIMGSSAGGHLASTIATHSKGEARPDFQILFYPVITMMPGFTHKGSHDNLLGSKAKSKAEKQYSNDEHVDRTTPRAFIVLSDDDHVVPPVNGANYYMECYRHDVPASLHIFPDGGHGWGSLSTFAYHTELVLTLRSWLESF